MPNGSPVEAFGELAFLRVISRDRCVITVEYRTVEHKPCVSAATNNSNDDDDDDDAVQLVTLGDSLRPINSTAMTEISVQLVNATGGGGDDGGGQSTAMTAADLRAGITVMLRLANIYSSRRRSLILEQSTMRVSFHRFTRALSLFITLLS